ncbi:hypothetical protein BOX15_Mlig002561g2, partial [Macrostomum lignano]
SANYSAGLSEYSDKGTLGLPETHESQADWELKARQLVDLIRQPGARVVVHTGAGVSTSAGIPDFRGPNGVWTLEREGRTVEAGAKFEEAQPTLTHAALVALETAGFVHYLVTQNVDGLHLRSGFPRNRLSILHGDMFVERCARCGLHRARDQPVETVGQKATGRRCGAPARRGRKKSVKAGGDAGDSVDGICGGQMLDTVLDWEHQLPQVDLRRAREHSSRATVNLTLGTSLQIVPAADLPTMGGKLVIINLQPTKKDAQSYLRINARCDLVMALVCRELLGIDAEEMLRPLLRLQPLRLFSKHTRKSERFPWRFAESDQNQKIDREAQKEAKCEIPSTERTLESSKCTSESAHCTSKSTERTLERISESTERTLESSKCTSESAHCTSESTERTLERISESTERTLESAQRTSSESSNQSIKIKDEVVTDMKKKLEHSSADESNSATATKRSKLA